MTRKTLSLLLALVLLLTLVPAAFAEEIRIVDAEGREIPFVGPDATIPVLDPQDTAANEQTIYTYLKETMGLNTAAACGILANIWFESGFDPHTLGDAGTSYGICQWHNERWDNLKAYCEEKGLDWQSLEGQLRFLEYELTSFFPGLCGTLSAVEVSAEGAYDAGYAWCYSFERPYDYPKVSVTRGNFAKDTYWPKYFPPFGSLPEAALEEAVGGAGTLRLKGWAFDPDATDASVTVRVYVGGAIETGADYYALEAKTLRQDVGAAHPGAGDRHGFEAELEIAERGSLSLYFYACDLKGGYPAKLFATASVFVSDPSQPQEPLVLSLQGMSTAGVALSWTAVPGATDYELLRYDSAGPSAVQTGRTDYLDAAAQMGRLYTYSVRARAGGAWTDYGTDLELLFNPFADVSGTKTVEYVAWAFNNGIVNGTSTTGFSPDDPCTRVQFVMMLWKMHGSPVVGGKNPFSDISGKKTTNAILWALDAGVINSGEKFYPNDNISRVQIVIILWKLAGSPTVTGENPFKDVSGKKTTQAVLWAYQNGITKGTSATTFAPEDDCTRVQLVVFLYKYNGLKNVI